MLIPHWDVLETMGKTFSYYCKDDELAEKIDEQIDNGRFHNQAHFFTEAAEMMIEEEEADDVLT